MKVVMRPYGSEDSYTIKDVEMKTDGGYFLNGARIKETNILSVISKDEFVTCSACGEIIKNTPKDIREHIRRKESHKGCLNCSNLNIKTSDKADKTVKYVMNEDGTFHRTLNDNVVLECNQGYYNRFSITSEKRQTECRYAKCSKETLSVGSGFFAKYPNAFDEMITVDTIDFTKINKSGTYTVLQLRCRGIIFAYANKNGIIDFFRARTRNDQKNFYYSKKYNKLFIEKYGHYEEFSPDYYWTSDKLDYIKKTIAKLYV